MSKLTTYFTKSELLLWSASIIFILGSFILFDRENYLTLAASLIGATSLIYCAKGNPFGQFLMVVFSIMYGAISYTFDYYGEMITYVGMTGPMALFALIAWLRNPYNGNRAEVKVNELTKREIVFMFILAGIVTFAFYFILKNFNTANLAPSTLSVTTSFIGVYLTFRRSAYYALAYALNDIILILLWILATLTDISYMSVIICFVMFLVNDLYGFINWTRMKKTQKNYGKQIGIMIK
ncbi:nicotinamide riboside transporter PnuC [Lachnospiraceae bacterium HCP1S3_C3]|nr:nicotinamide riboside transporter PnuC [Lachnospiraceae bacterium]